MDNNKEQTMQNWKKLLILDPVLNSLFQSNLDIKDFLHQQILTLEHQQIVAIYSRLSSVRHALSKNIQKQVETKHQIIQKSYLSKHQIQTKMKIENIQEVETLKKSLQSFNSDYEVVKQGSVKLQNLAKIIKFSKALEKLKINVRLLKTFMKDHMSSTQPSTSVQNKSPSTSPTTRLTQQQSLNLPKVSKLLKQISQLITRNDFTGIKYYEQQKSFISNAKQTLYVITQKQLNRTIEKYRELVREQVSGEKKVRQQSSIRKEKLTECANDIKQKLIIMHSINKLRQYIPIFGKSIFSSTSQQMKTLFQHSLLEHFSDNLHQQVLPLLLINSYILLTVQQLLYESSLSQHLQSTYNLPNLFMKYVQHLVSYWKNLVNWNMEQDIKQGQKRKAQESREMVEIMISSGSSSPIGGNKSKASPHQIKIKLPLWCKYPILYNGLSILVNKLHQQVLLHAEYNSKKYQFFEKKQKIMQTLIPLARRFYKKIDTLILNPLKSDSIDAETLHEKIENLQWVYQKILQNVGQQQSSVIVMGMNGKILEKIQECIFKKKISQYQQKQLMITQLLKIIDKKQLLISYNDLSTVIQHLQIIKQIKNYLKKCQKTLTQNEENSDNATSI